MTSQRRFCLYERTNQNQSDTPSQEALFCQKDSQIQNFRPEIFKNFFPFALSCEIFYFHLLKFPRPEQKIPRRYFIPESLADLSQTERQSGMKRIHHIFEIDKHSLRSFRPKIRNGTFVLHRTDIGLEHHIKMFFFRNFSAAIRTFIAKQMIRSKFFMAILTLNERVGKAGNMA